VDWKGTTARVWRDGRMFIEQLAVRGLAQLSEWPEDVTPIGSSKRSARPGDLGVARAYQSLAACLACPTRLD
jgi:hypothetical protein